MQVNTVNKQSEHVDFETLFQTLHQLKMKIDQRLKWWLTLRWLFILTPVVILILILPIGLDSVAWEPSPFVVRLMTDQVIEELEAESQQSLDSQTREEIYRALYRAYTDEP